MAALRFRRPLLHLLAASTLWAGTAPAVGAPLVLRLDPRASSVRFALDALAHTIHGSLRVVRGEVRFDPDTGEAAGEIAVDARSGETGNSSRDRTMHAEVLESARYPEIVFSPAKLSGRLAMPGESDLELAGAMRIHGASHPVTLQAHAVVTGTALRASGTLRVPYVEWGLEDPSNLFLRVAKQVEVRLEAQGALE
jgi:polyisoprenoid-binding protein YceI